jgi:hypothetical protein
MGDSIWGKLTSSFGDLKKKITDATTPAPAPSAFSNATSINGGSKRRGSKRRGSKRKRTKKVRFSKKHKVYTYKISKHRRRHSKRK